MMRRWLRRLRVPVLGLALLAVWLALPAAASATVHTSPQGIRLIEHFEGLVLSVAPDPVGIPTVCYGQTAADGPLPAHATPAECEQLLHRSLARGYEPYVRARFLPGGRLRGLFNQHRFDMLVSITYNGGPGLLDSIVRDRDLHAIAARMLAYDHAGGRVLPGLSIRRRAEASLFLQPMGRFELWPPGEIFLVRRLDRLHGHNSRRAERVKAELRARVAVEVARLRRVIHEQHDGLSHRRFDRLKALERRLPRATTGALQ
jgi:lysozyme